jgi:DNA anti-recombination protein RmuC
MIAGGIISSVLGGLYGAFEVYKDYQSMKEAIQTYVAPDLSEFDKRLTVVEKSSRDSVEYTNEIKNDLKQDLRRVEKVVEDMERSNKDMQRDVDRSITTARVEMRALQKEVDLELKNIRREMDDKLKKALDNPLANQ